VICFLGVCALSANLTSGGTYTEETPSISIDNANRAHNISHFYKPKNEQFNIAGYVILDTNTRIDLNYDNGLKSQKRIRGKSLDLGLTQLSLISESSFLTYGASTTLGGKITNIACRDESGLERLFYCDNLSTLKPFKASGYKQPYKVSFKYIYKY